jgi:hypothetical protein
MNEGRAGRDGSVSYFTPGLLAFYLKHPLHGSPRNAFFITVGRASICISITADPPAARQDATEIRGWVTSAHNTRRDMDGPPPSQRAIDSLSAVCALYALPRHNNAYPVFSSLNSLRASMFVDML